MNRIIVINPGSTSTKLSVFSILKDSLQFLESDLYEVASVHVKNEKTTGIFLEDLKIRRKRVSKFIKDNKSKINKVEVVVGRGGLLKPLKGGVYRVNDDMINDLLSCRYGTHASNMGAILAKEAADLYRVEAFIAYPVVVDEMDDLVRYTGFPEIQRKSIFHALNQKSVARRVAEKLGKDYKDLNIIVAHLGGGITIGLHAKGEVVDVNNGLDGDGPFSIERAGSVPPGDLIKICFSGNYTYEELYSKLVSKGGIFAYLGTKDANLLENILSDKKDYEQSDSSLTKENVKSVIDACIYQVSKNICSLACYTCGQVDAIALTGGLAYFSYFVQEIERRVSFLGKVFISPGEDEMRALCENVFLAIKGKEKIYDYRSEG